MEFAVHDGCFFLLDSVFIVVSRNTLMEVGLHHYHWVYVVAHFLPLRSIFSVPNLRLEFMFGKDGFTLHRPVLAVLSTLTISITV